MSSTYREKLDWATANQGMQFLRNPDWKKNNISFSNLLTLVQLTYVQEYSSSIPPAPGQGNPSGPGSLEHPPGLTFHPPQRVPLGGFFEAVSWCSVENVFSLGEADRCLLPPATLHNLCERNVIDGRLVYTVMQRFAFVCKAYLRIEIVGIGQTIVRSGATIIPDWL